MHPTNETAHRSLPTRLLIADSQPAMRLGLRAVFADTVAWEIVGEVGDVSGLERDTLDLRPDVVITDVHLGGSDAVPTLERLRDAAPHTRIVVFSMLDGEDALHRSLKAGARAYLLKEAGESELRHAVTVVAQGRRHITPVMAAKLAEHLDGQPLSGREIEILQFLATGLPNKSIARQAAITEGTVKFHVNKILGKLCCRTRTEAVATALRRGLIRMA